MILSLLLFEQGYLGYHMLYKVEIFTMHSSHCPLGKRVADILSQISDNFLDIFKTFFSKSHNIKTRA